MHPLITKFIKSSFYNFVTLDEAEVYMTRKEVKNYKYVIKYDAEEITPQRGQKEYYIIINN